MADVMADRRVGEGALREDWLGLPTSNFEVMLCAGDERALALVPDLCERRDDSCDMAVMADDGRLDERGMRPAA